MRQLRLLPVTIVAIGALLGLRAADLWTHVGSAQAQSPQPSAAGAKPESPPAAGAKPATSSWS